MSREIGKVNCVLLNERIKAARGLAAKLKSKSLINSILDFIHNNPNRTYYSIIELLEASQSYELETLMDGVLFLSSKPIKVFTLQFCYFPAGSDQTIEITPESYFEAKTHGWSPVDRNGKELEDVDFKRLGFSCFIHPELRHI